MTAAAYRTTGRVAARSAARSRFATSWPCAMTTSGARAARQAQGGRARGGGGAHPRRSGREQEVGEHDVGPRAPRRADGGDGQPQVLGGRAAAAGDGAHLDLVSERTQLAHERDQEAAEV